ncbi:Trichodiene oxygenase [Cytospora mali]|uniref:Trichodiene oxygenase n=1 Tax=Cytospora mali TaxID=578113 RepID=A0A194UNW4_CYTMA|nr:Trichodiene oxygenase [Valsa mali var. pyri (nom. inval.)]
MHRLTGAFVRINPNEVHCNDPHFFNELYVSSGKRRTDKTIWQARQSSILAEIRPTYGMPAAWRKWSRNSTSKTLQHDLHRQRRSRLSPFLSKASIRSIEPLVSSKVSRLCSRLEQMSDSGTVVSLTDAFVALTLDIISQVCFGYSYDFLEADGYAKEWHTSMDSMARSQHMIRQFPWVFYLVGSLARFTHPGLSIVAGKKRQEDLFRQVQLTIDRHTDGEKPPSDSFTVFDSILDAKDVPPAEKSLYRLAEEAQALIGAGSLTTANTLETVVYYLLSTQDCLSLLLVELAEAFLEPTKIPTLTEVEKLPYLTAVIYEGLRLSIGVMHRLSRISPDVPYKYHDVTIPRGVAVGMTVMNILENPDIFPDPDTFNPERWLPLGSPEVRQRYQWLQTVFGGGTRICLGINLAWEELYLATACVVRRFGGRLKLYDVVLERDVKISVDGFNALPSNESKGVRVIIS